ncbi:MAG TPA: TetR/AcrR family transcriptional regulator [Gammaproteobacteria bacterium]|nr:TetR family transcriptional regulator [Gammaproteobacteria bacterium]MEC8011181.1 TetR/AcrR family transcriptional regulator [Pseudomonadota bacterium]HBF08541.1 TetR/AcrR family transcriptional regulator [Gammaproteobacteria bacterium]HCK94013.1 TetR/AcrR family transcriptional regulator [Gammaproteobacteria bacterium]|tara:strand:- start:226 stop:792 length:567 start_codon:yes stop_codon:yes gene_type:complete
MARPKSDDKRKAILTTACHLISQQGLSAPTAQIAKEAGISSGSLFTYFENKNVLFNELYIELKGEIAQATLSSDQISNTPSEQLYIFWKNLTYWLMRNHSKTKTLQLLNNSDDINDTTRKTGEQSMAKLASLIDEVRQIGAMKESPLSMVVAYMESLVHTTVDFMSKDVANSEEHCKTGFKALWRVIR